jgi:hypothetical protein
VLQFCYRQTTFGEVVLHDRGEGRLLKHRAIGAYSVVHRQRSHVQR